MREQSQAGICDAPDQPFVPAGALPVPDTGLRNEAIRSDERSVQATGTPGEHSLGETVSVRLGRSIFHRLSLRAGQATVHRS